MDKTEELIESGAVEIFEEDSIITLCDDKKNQIEFFEIASIEYDGKFYELLKPVKELEGLAEDEAVILEYDPAEDGEEKTFKPITDEELLNSVFEVYLRAAADGCDDGCGDSCGCDGCGHGHHGEK